ncbi:hypothetical protein E4U55_005082 [Claviceps digitariae]|nr:hypothetical protein E4U55_005082 [Claviceps digitariae]
MFVQYRRKSFIDGRDNNNLPDFRSRGLIHGPQPEGPPPDAPSDCSISSRAIVQGVFGSPTRSPAKRRRRAASMDDGDQDADHDDDFQTDARQDNHPDQIRAELKASNPLPPTARKRQALPSQQPPSSLTHPPDDPSAILSNAKFPYPLNLNNIRNRKAEIVYRFRNSGPGVAAAATITPSSSAWNSSALPPPSTTPSPSATANVPSHLRQRHKWSDRDSATLIELIAQERAGWSIIEQRHNDKFEHPRNQQAYRDRARNMKVDFLLADAVLPPCFDLVVLGKKEIDKVLAGGRNPFRKEHEFIKEGDVVKVINALR